MINIRTITLIKPEIEVLSFDGPLDFLRWKFNRATGPKAKKSFYNKREALIRQSRLLEELEKLEVGTLDNVSLISESSKELVKLFKKRELLQLLIDPVNSLVIQINKQQGINYCTLHTPTGCIDFKIKAK